MTFITVLIAFVSLLLMVVILIQNPKGGGVDATFGGAQANQLFGAAKSADFESLLSHSSLSPVERLTNEMRGLSMFI